MSSPTILSRSPGSVWQAPLPPQSPGSPPSHQAMVVPATPAAAAAVVAGSGGITSALALSPKDLDVALKVALIAKSDSLKVLVVPSVAPLRESHSVDAETEDLNSPVFQDSPQGQQRSSSVSAMHVSRTSPRHLLSPHKKPPRSPAVFSFPDPRSPRSRQASTGSAEMREVPVMPFTPTKAMIQDAMCNPLRPASLEKTSQKHELSLSALLRKPPHTFTSSEREQVKRYYATALSQGTGPDSDISVLATQFFNTLLERSVEDGDGSPPPSVTCEQPSPSIHKPDPLNEAQIVAAIQEAVETNFPGSSVADLGEMLEVLMTMQDTHKLIPQILSHSLSPMISKEIIKRLLSYCLTKNENAEETKVTLTLLVSSQFSSQLTIADLKAQLSDAIQNISQSSDIQAAPFMAFIEILLSSSRALELSENDLQQASTTTVTRIDAKTRGHSTELSKHRLETILTSLHSQLALIRQTREARLQILENRSNLETSKNIIKGLSQEVFKRLLSYDLTISENIEESKAILTLLMSPEFSSQLTVNDLKEELLTTIQHLRQSSDTHATRSMIFIQIVLSSRASEFSVEDLKTLYTTTSNCIEDGAEVPKQAPESKRILDTYHRILGLLQLQLDSRVPKTK